MSIDDLPRCCDGVDDGAGRDDAWCGSGAGAALLASTHIAEEGARPADLVFDPTTAC
jgi:hypothetical protein